MADEAERELLSKHWAAHSVSRRTGAPDLEATQLVRAPQLLPLDPHYEDTFALFHGPLLTPQHWALGAG